MNTQIGDAVPLSAEVALDQEMGIAAPAEGSEVQAMDGDIQADSNVPIIFGSNGRAVTCTYVNHPAWDETANICMTLHFIMLKLGPKRSSAWGYSMRLTIQYFLDFLKKHNLRNNPALHINHIKDLTPSIYRAFGLFLDKIGKSRKHAQDMKTAIKKAGEESNAVPPLDLPMMKKGARASTEPLSEEGVKSLTLATRTIVDNIRDTISRRKLIDESEPYTHEELLGFFTPKLTKRDIIIWIKHKVQKGEPIVKEKALLRLEKCDDPDIVALSKERVLRPKLLEMAAAHPDICLPEGYDPDGRRLDSWQSTVLDPYRVVKTFNDQRFPFNLSNEELLKDYNSRHIAKLSNCKTAIQLILNKFNQNRTNYNKLNEHTGLYMLSLDEHMALYYPTAIDMAGLASLMMLQSGWNKETVMDVDKDRFEHPLTSTVEESIKIITSEKVRGQGSSVPYLKPKQILAASDSDNPFSSYNLILLAKEFTAPLAPFLNGVVDPLRNRQVNTLFAYVRPWSGWLKADGSTAINTMDYASRFQIAIKELLANFEVIDNGKRLTSASEVTRRLRATWLFYNAEELPFAFLSQLMGHQSRDTTDSSYDNSPQARTRRLKRLRSVLEHIVELLRARKFKGLLGKRARTQAETKLSIFFLPHLERPLWACSNRFKPDWPGAPVLAKGVKCDALDQCFFCSRVWILEDSLPYLIERLAHIDELLRDGSISEFGNRLEAEQENVNTILDEWVDEDAIDEALQYRTLNSPLLPRNLRDLRLIFKTGDLDE
ncbi:hypothetical protein [Pseudomonas guariconensis]|uniref:hypothetical protein n=1 Tax=Pseudomonas guariconensis TaxID=1288410 RepID=UPI0018A9A88E|nr:hypothetical protein [Pseudomonas guariconensis]MBF8742126.1 hypothetical protein [Pseudomonas guariconensis]MBF8751122.1 hypothetical protein [Pseudomonas guariconensis]